MKKQDIIASLSLLGLRPTSDNMGTPEVFEFGDDDEDGIYVKDGFAGLAVPMHDSVKIIIRSGPEATHHIWEAKKILLIKPGTVISRFHEKRHQHARMKGTGQSEKDAGTSEQAECSQERLIVYFTMFGLQGTNN